MWTQIKRSIPPRPLKTAVDRPPAPAVGPAITARKTTGAHGGSLRVSWKFAVGLTGGVFAIGLAAGVGIGIFSVEAERPATDVAMPLANDWPIDETTLEAGGYTLPVTVYRSERAILEEFAYEETTPAAPENATELAAIPEPPDALVTASTVSPTPVIDDSGPILLIGQTGTPGASRARLPGEAGNGPGPAALATGDEPAPTQLARSSAMPLWRQNAVPAAIDFTKPLIAMVIDDVGINQPRSRRTIALDGRLTIAFIAYGYNLPELVGIARENGHEIMVHVPTEPLSPGVDPGPNALLTTLSLAEIKRRLDWNLSRFDGYVGFNNHMGSKFSAWTPGMEIMIREAKARGLLFMDSITSSDTIGYRLARAAGVPNTTRDVFIDHDLRREAIARQLRRTEGIAKSRGYAVAIGHPHEETLDELEIWLKTVESRGFQLVPISAIVRRNYPQG